MSLLLQRKEVFSGKILKAILYRKKDFDNERVVATVVLTSKDTLLKGGFQNNVIKDGPVVALYSNAEFYNGTYKSKYYKFMLL
jgi:hypothetical protein